jgi:hypothetical protein
MVSSASPEGDMTFLGKDSPFVFFSYTLDTSGRSVVGDFVGRVASQCCSWCAAVCCQKTLMNEHKDRHTPQAANVLGRLAVA